MLTAQEIQAWLDLQAHPQEGGFFVETYRSEETLSPGVLPARYGGSRSLATAIYYLLTPQTRSALHRLASDEIFHFYLGDPVEMLQLRPDGSGEVRLLGFELRQGMAPQVVVPRGVWQGARLRPGGRLALMGTTVSPGFDDADYETGRPEELRVAYPQFRKMIRALSP